MVLNFIAVAGFVLSIIAIPLCPLCLVQILAFIVSIVGYIDAMKCNNKGKALGMIGMILSGILMVAGPIILYLMIKGTLNYVLASGVLEHFAFFH